MARSAARSATRPSAGVRVPLLGTRVQKPDRGSVAWYVGLGMMGALEVIEWPVAVLVGVSHALATHTRNPELREAAEGVEAGT